jgi:DNA repair exonuclease SbcCD nuclease subunit
MIAIAIADVHLGLNPPACRAETDWLAVQAGYLKQVKEIANGCPILCAGDLFDRWNPPPELITFALRHLPNNVICVPGNHDLPLHRADLMHRSGYGVLVEAGKIVNQSYSKWMNIGFTLTGFGCGAEIVPPTIKADLQVALIHRYCWVKGAAYPGAPEESHLRELAKQLKGYQIAIVGDNHQHFIRELKSGLTVCNVGTLIRRKSDEIDYQPCVAIINADGTTERQMLDTSKDKFHANPKEREETALDMKAFIDELEGLGEHGLNFREAVENHLRSDGISPGVKEIILKALE